MTQNPGDPHPAPVPAGAGTTLQTPTRDRVQDLDLRSAMSTSYLDYAMSVIVGRALPDVRDGLKPVHRRVLFGMYDGGYRPDRAFVKCARIVGDVMGNFHPHGDSAIYDTLVRLAQPWSLRQPLVQGQGNFGSQGDDAAAAMRYTEARLTPLAMELMRDLDEDTVDHSPNYDGRSSEPDVMPARFPNLLVNGSGGIAVGMATNIPPHNLTEVNDAVQWALVHPDADEATLLAAAMERVHGPDFPTGAFIAGTSGVEEAQRTGRGSVRMRAVVTVEEDARGRTRLVVTELPYQVNKDALLRRIKDLVESGKIGGIADLNDEGSTRTGLRLVITLKRDAVAKVVLNHLYRHTQLQETFGVNTVALVDGVPRTLNLAQMITHWVDHQVEVIVRRTQYRLRRAQERDHLLQGYLAALDALDQVIALIRASDSVDDARAGLIALLGIDAEQATAVLDMQLRRLAALERTKVLAEHEDLVAKITDFQAVIADPARQRQIIGAELAETTERHALPRATTIVPFEGDLAAEDFITREDVVVTITRSGYAKRTRVEAYRSQRRGGKGVRGATLREDDIVDHFLIASTHDTVLTFTDQGRVYRTKAHEIAEGGRDAKGQHLANLMGFQPGERVAQVAAISGYDRDAYLVLATRAGLVKKTRLTDYDTRMSGGLIAVSLREGDALVSAAVCTAADDLLLISREGQAARFTASDQALRPTGRATSGVTGIRFRDGDALLSMLVIRDEQAAGSAEAPSEEAAAEAADGHLRGASKDVFVVTAGGYAKRTPVQDYPVKGRGGLGVMAARTDDDRGALVGALLVGAHDEVMAITSAGGVIRTPVAAVRATGRTTMGVRLLTLGKGGSVRSVAVNRDGAAQQGAALDASEDVTAENNSAAQDATVPVTD